MTDQPGASLPPSQRPPAGEIVTPGIVAGVAAAVIMGLLAMIVSAAKGMGFFTPMKLISATFLGPRAMTTIAGGAAGAVVLGIGMHLVIGAVFGVLYAAYLPRRVGVGAEVGISLLYGAAVFLVMTFLIMPWADPVMFAHVDKWWLLVYHLAYGLSLVLVLPIRREIRATAPARQAHGAA